MSLFILYNKNIMFYLNLSKIIRKYKNFIKILIILSSPYIIHNMDNYLV